MQEVEQRDIDSHGNRFIAGEPQVQPGDAVIRDEWAKRYETPLVEEVPMRRCGLGRLQVICFHHVAPLAIVSPATSE